MKGHIRCIMIFVTISIIHIPSYSQVERLVSFENEKNKMIVVGMSTDEVKKVLGRPKAVEGGFPNSNNSIISELPEQAGQMNNSTWFYFFDKIIIKVDDPTYKVNGFSVSREEFLAYEQSDKVYIYDDQIIHPGMAESYIVLKDPKLKIIQKDPAETYENIKPKKVRKSFTPIFCVVFDKGTQIVAATKMFFLMTSTK